MPSLSGEPQTEKEKKKKKKIEETPTRRRACTCFTQGGGSDICLHTGVDSALEPICCGPCLCYWLLGMDYALLQVCCLT